MIDGTSALNLTAVAKPRDLSRFDPRPRVRQAAMEQPMPRTAPTPAAPAVKTAERARTRAAARPAMRLSVSSVLLFVAALGVLMFIVSSYMQLSSLNSQNSKAEAEINSLRKQENILRKQYESVMNLSEIERFAVEELGMVMPDPAQIKYVKLSGNDHAEIIEQKTVWDYLGSLFSTVTGSVVEYLE